jgi:hypothetical protein
MITGPWPEADIIVANSAITIPFYHLRPGMVQDLLDYALDIGNLELHDALTEVAIELGDE